MKIRDVEAHAIRMPFIKVDIPISIGPVLTPVIIRIRTDEGVTGVGEAFGYFNSAVATAMIVKTMLRPILLGKDPMEIEKLWRQMYRNTHYAGSMGIVVSAISGWRWRCGTLRVKL